MRLAIFRVVLKVTNFFRSFGYCHKEMLGYNCKHAIYNGMRECDGKKV